MAISTNLFAARKHADKVLHPVVSRVARIPLSPNAWTLIGTLVGIGCGVILYLGWWFTGFVLFALRGLLDHVDGYVARSRNMKSTFGAIADDIADRWVLGLIYAGGSLRLAEIYPHLAAVFAIGLTGALTNVIAKQSIVNEAQEDATRDSGKLGHPVDRIGVFGSAEFFIYFGIPLLAMAIFQKPVLGAIGVWLVAVMAHLSLIQRVVFAFRRYRR